MINKMKKQIVFVEPYSTVMIYKLAMLLRKKGYETVLIQILGNKGVSKEFHNIAFDKIIYFNVNFFKMNFKNFKYIFLSITKNVKTIIKAVVESLRLKPYAVLVRASPNWPSAISRILTKRAAFIYFPYDIRSQSYDTLERAKKAGVPKFEIKSERFCFEHADGIMHKGDPNELKFLENRMLGKNIKLPHNQLSFFPYCAGEFIIPINKNKLSKKDGGIHIVFVNSMGAVGPGGETSVFDNFVPFVKAGIHIHLYSIPNSGSNEQVRKFFTEDSAFTRDYKELITSKFFHYHDPVEPNMLSKEISKYDFGMWTSPEKREGNIEPDMATGNRLASYLEAGIPLISNSSYKFVNKLGHDYGIAVSYNLEDKEQMKNIKKIISKLDMKKIEKNIINARKDFLMEKNVNRFEEFMEKVSKNKKRR
ncbi:Uncharacterised protein [uncultured archaeon]|nr:Uncharacterised protein [uncultured archaeon]